MWMCALQPNSVPTNKKTAKNSGALVFIEDFGQSIRTKAIFSTPELAVTKLGGSAHIKESVSIEYSDSVGPDIS
jgi:hypothetical protein